MNQPELQELHYKLAAFDALDIPLVYFDSAGMPIFLSARAAKLLGTKSRQEPESYSSSVEPLTALVAKLSKKMQSQGHIEDTRPKAPEILELRAVDGRVRKVLAFPKQFNLEIEGIEPCQWVAIFYDLDLIEPFIKTVEDARKNRAALVLASCVQGRNILAGSGDGDVVAAYQAAESDFFKQTSVLSSHAFTTDLLSGLNATIDIVDPLLISSAKLKSEVRIGALLKISSTNFTRIVSHLLFEATDFLGPSGTTIISSNFADRLVKDQESGKENTEKQLELHIKAKRNLNISLDASPIALYLYYRCIPLHYKITIGERTPSPLDNPISLGWNASISESLLSDNLRIASHIARHSKINLSAERHASDTLHLMARFPIE